MKQFALLDPITRNVVYGLKTMSESNTMLTKVKPLPDNPKWDTLEVGSTTKVRDANNNFYFVKRVQ